MKKWVKVVLYSLLGIVVIIGGVIGYFYYQHDWKYEVNEKKYPNNIGHLSIVNKDFNLCNEDRIIGWFANAAMYTPIFNGSKSSFKKYILEHYISTDDTDNGFLNLRFIINCKGEVGRMEINELDIDYKPSKFSPNLVKQIIKLSSRKENWKISSIKGEQLDSYMYLIYKIEDGEISEILP